MTAMRFVLLVSMAAAAMAAAGTTKINKIPQQPNRKLMAQTGLHSVDSVTGIKCSPEGVECLLSAQCCEGTFCGAGYVCQVGEDPNQLSSAKYIGQTSDKPSDCLLPPASCWADSQCCEGSHCSWSYKCTEGAPSASSVSSALFGQQSAGCYPEGADCSDYLLQDPCCPGVFCKPMPDGRKTCQA